MGLSFGEIIVIVLVAVGAGWDRTSSRKPGAPSAKPSTASKKRCPIPI